MSQASHDSHNRALGQAVLVATVEGHDALRGVAVAGFAHQDVAIEDAGIVARLAVLVIVDEAGIQGIAQGPGILDDAL